MPPARMRVTMKDDVVARLVSSYDEDDEALMAWLSLPDVKARFAASRERAASGQRVSREDALRELEITEEELAAERDRLDVEDPAAPSHSEHGR